ncbi:MAG: adenine-specific methyltransferase EcoRI family protein [Dysgonamonadaceae bacterium]|nr:adenine-specific methyltransferase EcoRI family protein [Dysgonamonadaceae bacterium]
MAKKLNSNLHTAKQQKNDEFYTQLADIEREMLHYKEHFIGKTIYCNCDDPEWSNFFRYFALNVEHLGLKKLITTHFVYSDMFVEGETYKLEITKGLDVNADGKIDFSDVVKTALKGNGDFRGSECIQILQEADIVVTNPPFSLFREYMAQLIKYEKKFLIIGDQNAITYKEVFKFIKENKVWLGFDNGGTKWFQVPDNYDIQTESRKKIENGIKYFSKGSIMWYTNLDHTKRHKSLEEIGLFKTYTPAEYSKYDNYDAIEVSKVVDIPIDYDGIMGVPITFLDKYNPEYFKILGLDDHRVDWRGRGPDINGTPIYRRIIIQKIK